MRNEYITTLDGDIIKYPKWYIDGNHFSYHERRKVDYWCRSTFGKFRHDNEVDEGWWLQNKDEYTLFMLTWSDDIHRK